VTVSAFGDPHIRPYSLITTHGIQTCNEVGSFEGNSTTSEPITLIENDFYKLMATLGRFSSLINGTFVQEVGSLLILVPSRFRGYL